METFELLERARRAAGLSQSELARRAGTSRPTLSAYEHGRKSPTIATAARLLEHAGFGLSTEPRIVFENHLKSGGRPVWVPSLLPRLEAEQAFARVTLPLHLNWSTPGRIFDLALRSDRARVYEVVLREGRPVDIETYIDGLLLIDMWHELVLPPAVREGWEPLLPPWPEVAATRSVHE